MGQQYGGVERQRNMVVEDYFALIENLPVDDKIELIAKISHSILENKKQEEQSKNEILTETYGCFQTEKSADEIIDEIYQSRRFIDKNFEL
jgi:adenosine deaminase